MNANNPYLPVEILDRIFQYTSVKMILPFEKYMYKSTIKYLLRDINIHKLLKNKCLQLIELTQELIPYPDHIWNTISNCDYLTMKFIIKNINKLDIESLEENYVLPECIIRKFPNKVNWQKIIDSYNVSDMIIYTIWTNIDWKYKKRMCAKISRYDYIGETLKQIITTFSTKASWVNNGGKPNINQQMINSMAASIKDIIESTIDCNKSYHFGTVASILKSANWGLICKPPSRSRKFRNDFKNKLHK